MNRLVVHSTTHVIILIACSKIVFCKALTLWIFPGKVVSFSLSPLLYPSRISIITFFGLFLSSILPVVCLMVLRTLPYLSYLSNSGAPSQLLYQQISFIFLSPGELQSLQNNSTLFLHLYCHRNCEPSASVEATCHSIDGL